MANRKPCTQCEIEGYYVGPQWAYEDPLHPGIFLLPGEAIWTPIPYKISGFREWKWSWTDEVWSIVPGRRHKFPWLFPDGVETPPPVDGAPASETEPGSDPESAES